MAILKRITNEDYPKITEKYVLDKFYGEKYNNYDLMCPNVNPDDWWENDMLCITKSDYWLEMEVKLSRADFKNDAKKSRMYWEKGCRDSREQFKYEALLAGKGPSRFSYIMPRGLVKVEELPPWAGLIEFYECVGRRQLPLEKGSRTYDYEEVPGLSFTEIRKAKQLHKNKVDDHFKFKMARKLAYRYWLLRKDKASYLTH